MTSYSFDDEKCSIHQTRVGAGHFAYFDVPSRPQMSIDEVNFIRNPSAYGLEQLTQGEYRDGAMILQRDPHLTVNALFWDYQITVASSSLLRINSSCPKVNRAIIRSL